MFRRILIANRGEIAVRIVRCCREMGIESVVIYSKADEGSLPVMLAGGSFCIGPAKSSESYLKKETILEAARRLGCDAIHPGVGFLSENADFAQLCEEQGICFIGPSSDVIRKMGDKQSARKLMMQNGVPVVPGSAGLVRSAEEAREEAGKIGYPVMIKASAGGGGKGIRKVWSENDMERAFDAAAAEAEASFGNDDLYLEKLIINPHHVEIQILADHLGNIIHLGERDCSVQKNNQKILEEAPSPFLNESLRAEMGECSVRAAKAAGYNSAGTVEFVVGANRRFYFIEMNTRIQVEHPVTEEITGIDLIREQIRIAAGMQLNYRQEDISIYKHAIECRINAGTTGEISALHFPSGFGVRTESYLFTGYNVTPFYDSLLAKIIVSGRSRLEAVRRMRRALEELVIQGVETNADLMHLVTFHPDFIKGKYDTGFWEKNHEELESWMKEGLKEI